MDKLKYQIRGCDLISGGEVLLMLNTLSTVIWDVIARVCSFQGSRIEGSTVLQ